MNRRHLLLGSLVVTLSCAPGPRGPGAEEGVSVEGVVDGAHVTDTLLPLEARGTATQELYEVDYAIDGTRVSHRTGPPWGWGEGGARVRDAGEIGFGAHELRVDAWTKAGHETSRALHIVYGPPLGRIPSYADDIAPLFRRHCASCHDHGLARDLASYDRLRAMIPRVRASVREGRMPPDFAIDAASVALITSWCDGKAPP